MFKLLKFWKQLSQYIVICVALEHTNFVLQKPEKAIKNCIMHYGSACVRQDIVASRSDWAI